MHTATHGGPPRRHRLRAQCRRVGPVCVWGAGCVVPSGPLTRNINRLGSTKSEKLKGPGTLEYDEYIVYAKTQAKIRYVVTVKFGTKGQSYDLT